MTQTPPAYFEQMRAHVDEGGQLSHRNGVDLLAEVERLQAVKRRALSLADERAKECAHLKQLNILLREETERLRVEIDELKKRND